MVMSLRAPALAEPANLAPVVDGGRRVFVCHRSKLDHPFHPNSLAAVQACVDARAPRIEVDVRFLADDAMLVFHDTYLEAETTGTGLAHRLNAASARLVRYRDSSETPLAFFEDVIDLIRGSNTVLQVDLKGLAPLSEGRTALLAAALEPIRSQVLIGSQAHWNLRDLALAGLHVALDPTLQLHYLPGRVGDDLLPARLGHHGLWDDAPIAQVADIEAADYVRARIADLRGLLPAVEWMVDHATIRYVASLGVPLGVELAKYGLELAAWTLHDEGPEATPELLRSMWAAGVTTIITDAPAALARYTAASVSPAVSVA
jgi:glycerophosphoryl diester phosphodiesterase